MIELKKTKVHFKWLGEDHEFCSHANNIRDAFTELNVAVRTHVGDASTYTLLELLNRLENK